MRSQLRNNLLVLVVTLVVLFIVLEIGVRAVGVTYVPFVFDACTGTKIKPGAHTVQMRTEFKTAPTYNSQGFRDVEHQIEKPPGTFRIVLLGDSYVEAAQVDYEESFGYLLEKQLNSSAVEVIKIATGGWGTDQELRALECYGLQYDPDLVIVEFLSANDPRNNLRNLSGYPCKPYYTTNEAGELILDNSFLSCDTAGERLKKTVGHSSRLVYFVYTTYLSVRAAPDTISVPPEYEVYALDSAPLWEEAWEISGEILSEIVDRSPVPVLVVVATNPEQLNWNTTVETYSGLSHGYDPIVPERKIAQLCTDGDLDCVYLLPAFLAFQKTDPRLLHYPINGHWTPLGNELAANVTAEYVARTYLR